MTDPKDKSDQDPFSDSSELFESLFKDAPLEDKKKPGQAPRVGKEGKPGQELRRKPQDPPRQPPRPKQEAPPVRQTIKGKGDDLPPRRRVDFSRTERGAARPAPSPRTQGAMVRAPDFGSPGPRTGEKIESGISLPSKSRQSSPKRNRGSRALKPVLFLLLLGAGAATAAAYLGFVDLGRYIGRPVKEESQPVPPKVAGTTSEKKPAQQIPVKAPPEKPKPQPAPSKGEAPAAQQVFAPPGDKLTRTDLPATSPAQKPLETPVKPPTRPSLTRPESKVAPATRPAVPPKLAQQPQPTPARQNLATAVPPPQKQPLSEEQPGQYPFSVYLGAFMTLDRARTAVSIYEKNHAISSHWVKVDLGEKGLWYRIFTGHFGTEHEAEAFIKQRQLQEGEVKRTRFSTLIGVYSKQGEAEETVRRLSQIGYSSYFVPGPGGGIKLYSGAFYTLEGAKKQQAELASKEIKSRVVER